MTQTLYGLHGQRPMHWRGDRPRFSRHIHRLQLAFNVAFEGLIGRASGPLEGSPIASLARFQLTIPYPPNPTRALDNSLTPAEANGRTIFTTALTRAPGTNSGAKPILTCNSCHLLDPQNNRFGSSGLQAFDALNQPLKVPRLRDLYQKIGIFGPTDLGASRQHRSCCARLRSEQ